jgi:dephospho-CoA kinase
LAKISELGIHFSERSWINENPNFIIDNDGNVEDLFEKIEELISDLESNRLDSKANLHYITTVDS